RARHDRPEVSRALAIDQVAPAVGALRLDERVIGVDRVFQHVIAIADAPSLLALRKARAVGRRRIERADPRTRRADSLCESALRHELELDLSGAVQRIEMPRVR